MARLIPWLVAASAWAVAISNASLAMGQAGPGQQAGSRPAAGGPRLLDEKLRGWTDEARRRINEFVRRRGRTSASFDSRRRPVAVFDWDNTVFKNDMGDATMYWMLRQSKVLQPAGMTWTTTNSNLTPAAAAALEAACGPLAAPGEPLPTGTASGAGCADEILAVYDGGRTTGGLAAFRNARTLTQKQTYAWLAQLQAGYTPDEIRGFARAAYDLASTAAMGSTQTVGRRSDVTAWGRIYDQMRDLVGVLQEAGFDVWVVTASPQFVIEPVAALVGVDASRVIGIRTAIQDGRATSRLQGCGGIADGHAAPITYDTGKRCWINKIVYRMPDGPAQLEPDPDLARRPAFAAGDSDTDIAFMKDATGLKVAINRNQVQLMCNAYADDGGRWVVQPMFLQPKAEKAGAYPCSTALDHGERPIADAAGRPIADQRDRVFELGR